MNTTITQITHAPHTAVIIQERRVVRYGVRKEQWHSSTVRAMRTTEHLDYVDLWEGSLDAPVMRENDAFLIVELGTHVHIKRVVRTSENKYHYFVREMDFVTDEYTEVSKQEAEEEAEDYNERARKFREEREKATVIEVKRPWYERWFGKWS